MSTETPNFESPTLLVRLPRSRLKWFVLALAILLALAVIGAHGYVNGSAFRLPLLAKARATLQDRFGHVEMGDALSVDWLGRVALGPISLRTRDGQPLVRIESLRIRPGYRALLAGRLEPASVTLQNVDLDFSSGTKPWIQVWRDLENTPRRKGHSGAAAPDAGTVFRWEDLRVLLGEGDDGRAREIGPFEGKFQLKRLEAGRVLTASCSLPGHGEAAVDGSLDPDGSATYQLTVEAPHLDAILEPIGLAVSPSRGDATFHATVHVEPQARKGTATLTAGISDLVVTGEKISTDPVGPVTVGGRGTVTWDQVQRRVAIEQGEISIGEQRPVSLKVEADVTAPVAADPHFRFAARIDKVVFQDAIDALPPQVMPGERVPKIEGAVSGDLLIKGPALRPTDWELAARIDVANLHAAGAASSLFLNGPFLYRASGQVGEPRDVVVGPRNPSFVPLGELPPYLVQAVLTSEDAGFFGHHGFDFQEIKDSVVSALAERRVRGASTITQQLSKNLFLSREKTYIRKVREALITLALEAAFSKSRLLEIYLNLIEWGPNVYGIGEAAQHYFGKDARRLTLKQAAFLATIIPNPIKYHFYFERGGLTETWTKRVSDLLLKLRDQGQVTEAEMSEANAAPLDFRERN